MGIWIIFCVRLARFIWNQDCRLLLNFLINFSRHWIEMLPLLLTLRLVIRRTARMKFDFYRAPLGFERSKLIQWDSYLDQVLLRNANSRNWGYCANVTINFQLSHTDKATANSVANAICPMKNWLPSITRTMGIQNYRFTKCKNCVAHEHRFGVRIKMILRTMRTVNNFAIRLPCCGREKEVKLSETVRSVGAATQYRDA